MKITDIQITDLPEDRLRSRFARALYFPDIPQKEEVHEQELNAIETALKSFVSGESAEDLAFQLDGQRNLTNRLKGDLRDNRSKLKSVLKDLKAARKRLTPLEEQIKSQQKELFEKSMTIDSQRVELKILRNEIGPVMDLKKKYSEAQSQLARIADENKSLKQEISDVREVNREISVSKNAGELEALNDKLHQATAREEMMDKRLEILRRDLDIVNQTNELLRNRLAELEPPVSEVPRRVVGY